MPTRFAFLLSALLLVATSPADAFGPDAAFVVFEAQGLDRTPGQPVDGNTPLVLWAGQSLKLVTRDGTLLWLEGPYEGPPAAAARQRPGAVVDVLATLGAPAPAAPVATAGTRGIRRVAKDAAAAVAPVPDDAAPAAFDAAGRSIEAMDDPAPSSAVAAPATSGTRGTGAAVRAAGPAGEVMPSPWVVNVTGGGDGCFRPGTPVVFWRPESADAAPITLATLDRGWTTHAVWPSGYPQLAPPPDLPVDDGRAFMVRYRQHDSLLTLHQVPDTLSGPVMTAAWMALRNCTAQARALLK